MGKTIVSPGMEWINAPTYLLKSECRAFFDVNRFDDSKPKTKIVWDENSFD